MRVVRLFYFDPMDMDTIDLVRHDNEGNVIQRKTIPLGVWQKMQNKYGWKPEVKKAPKVVEEKMEEVKTKPSRGRKSKSE